MIIELGGITVALKDGTVNTDLTDDLRGSAARELYANELATQRAGSTFQSAP